MSAPAWFDKDVYLANKLAQLQADEPNNGWTMLKMAEAFNNAGFNPFTDDGVYAHFVAFGNAEGISPNAYFDEDTYFANKLAQLQATEPDKGWTSVDQVKEAFADAGLSAWDHYTLFGAAEGVSPSKYFDTNAYMNAKLAQMQADDPAYTMTQLQQAFKDADLNPIEHYILFGKDENLSYSPYPIPVEDDKIKVELGDDGKIISVGGDKTVTTLPDGDYALIGSAAGLDAAAYNIVNGANGDITLKDELANLVSNGAVKSTATEALGLASKVVVEGKLADLVVADLPSEITAKSVSYLVTSSSSTVTFKNATVAQAVDAQATLDAFLANPYVEFESGNTPTDLKVKVESITDTVANLSAADLTQFDDATKFNVKDTVAGVEGMSLSLNDAVDGSSGSISVVDSLSNILGMDKPGLVNTSTVSGSFTATDTKDVNVTIDETFKDNFTGGTSDKTIVLSSLEDNQVLTFSLEHSEGTGGVTFNANLGFDISASGVTFDITGTDYQDTITANDLGGTIDGGLGSDAITLGKGDDTVVLGTGISSFEDFAANADSIAQFGSSGSDKIDFADFLADFDAADVTNAATDAGGHALNGKIVLVASKADYKSAGSIANSFFTGSDFAEDDNMILVTSDGSSSSYVWYVENTNGDTQITAGEITLVATLTDVTDTAKLSADNFA